MSARKFHLAKPLVAGILFLAFSVVSSAEVWPQTTRKCYVGTLVKVAKTSEKTTLNRQTQILTSVVSFRITNISSQTIATPLHAVFRPGGPGINMPGALGGPGKGEYGTYYYDLSRRLPRGKLSPRASLSCTATFARPKDEPFSYTVDVYGVVRNHPPIANAGPDQNVTLPEGVQTVNVTLTGSASTDSDGSITGYLWSGAPDPPDVVSPTVSLPAGIHTFTLVVTDNNGMQSSPDTVTIKVNKSAANQPPVANAGANWNLTIPRGQQSLKVVLDGRGSRDRDGTIVDYIWTGTPKPQDMAQPTVSLPAGTHTFTLVVKDDDGAESAPDSATVTVAPPAQNKAPIAEAGPDQYLSLPYGQESMAVTFSGKNSRDDDGVVATYIWSGTPDPEDTIQPTILLSAGTHTFSLVVVDNDGVSSSADPVTVKIDQEAPHAPHISASPVSLVLEEGQTGTISVSAGAEGSEPVTISASPLLRGSTFISSAGVQATGTFTFTPDYSQQGQYAVSFAAMTPQGFTASRAVEITVNNQNRPPSLSVPPSATVNEGGLLTLQVQAGDPDGDLLTLTAEPLPQNAVFIEGSSTILFSPGYDQAGSYNIVCTASDGNLAAPPQTVHITVNDVPTGGQGQPRELVLNVSPVQTPTLLTTQRISGAVNATPNPPPPSAALPPLITGMTPTSGQQGQTLEVVLTGSSSASYATHFASGVSQASLGAGITVNSLAVTGPTQAAANITISPLAGEGSRSVEITTGSEKAISILAFNVVKGKCGVTGRVIDFDTRQPISGALVTLQGTVFSGVTDTEGIFTFSDMPSGQHFLVANAADHEMVSRSFSAQAGTIVNVGTLELPATVYDPSAPPSVSLLSVLGRGIGDPVNIKKVDRLKRLITDTMLLVGGDEAGILDEYGNQLNKEVTGNGMISLTAKGLDAMIERLTRGETASLQEILFALSYGMQWSAGYPIDLGEWLQTLQELVNQAWQAPTNRENALPIILFSRESNLLPNPPTLSPFTRVNTFQGYLLIASLLTYAEQRVLEQTRAPGLNMLAMREGNPSIKTDAEAPANLLGRLVMTTPNTSSSLKDPSLGSKPFTRFWRNFFTSKASVIAMGIKQECLWLTVQFCANQLLAGTGLIGATLAAVNAGFIVDQLNSLLVRAHASTYALNPPEIKSLVVVAEADGSKQVQVTFSRSPNDNGPSADREFIYRLFYFLGDMRPRFLGALSSTGEEEMQWIVSGPALGTVYFTLTVTLLTDSGHRMVEAAGSWWPAPFAGAHWAFSKGRWRWDSDYCAPVSVYLGDAPVELSMDGLEVDPVFGRQDVYYSDASKGAIYRIADGGEGKRTLFANTNFKLSERDGRQISQVGLAIDHNGHLYCDNAASDSQFGGRVFKFLQTNGTREFSGSLGYFSQLLMFAQPVVAGPMAICPNADLFDRDLFVLEELTSAILRIPVNATYDPNRRVGHPYVAVPSNAGKIIDLTLDQYGNLYLLGMNELFEVVYDPGTGGYILVESVAKLRP